MNIDKVDIEILYMLYSQKKISPMKSFSVKNIIDNTNLNLSYHSILRRVSKKLIPSGYLFEGYKDGNSKNYYLSNKGIEYLKENIIE